MAAACSPSPSRRRFRQSELQGGSPLEMPRTPVKKDRLPCQCGCACISGLSRVHRCRPGDQISAANQGAVAVAVPGGMLGCRCSLDGPVSPLGAAFKSVHRDVGASEVRHAERESASQRLLFDEDTMETNTGDTIMAVNTPPSADPASPRAAPSLLHVRHQEQPPAFLSQLTQSTPAAAAATYMAAINLASLPNQSMYNEEQEESAMECEQHRDGQPAAHHSRPNMELNQPNGESEPAYFSRSTAPPHARPSASIGRSCRHRHCRCRPVRIALLGVPL